MSNTKDKKEKSIEAREAVLHVSKTIFGGETEEEERIAVRPFETTPATISVKAGATINLGNYESARFDILLTVPCYKEEVDDVFLRVKEWVDERVAQEYKETKKAAKLA